MHRKMFQYFNECASLTVSQGNTNTLLHKIVYIDCIYFNKVFMQY